MAERAFGTLGFLLILATVFRAMLLFLLDCGALNKRDKKIKGSMRITVIYVLIQYPSWINNNYRQIEVGLLPFTTGGSLHSVHSNSYSIYEKLYPLFLLVLKLQKSFIKNYIF